MHDAITYDVHFFLLMTNPIIRDFPTMNDYSTLQNKNLVLVISF